MKITDPSKPPLKLLLGSIKVQPSKKEFQKNAGKRLQIAFKVFLLPIALPQGQLKEVPIYFKNITIKVVGQIIQACSATKMSKL